MNKQNGNDENATPSGQDRKALEAEIVEDETWSNGSGQNFYKQRRRPFFSSQTITFAPIDNTGCAAAMITCFIFLCCLFQWGLLAGIGFIVFHTIGNIIASVYSARRLMRGLLYNIWNLRIINWVLSFFITAWLAGGFK